MAIFKKAWHDHFYGLAYSDSKARKELIIERNQDLEGIENNFFTENYGVLLAAITAAAPEVRQVLKILFEAPSEVLALIDKEIKTTGSKTYGANKALCKLVGVDPTKVNLKKMLHEALAK